MNRHTPWFLFAAILALVAMCVGAGGIALTGRAYGQRYDGRIYPGVTVYGVDLSGLTLEDAAASLQATFPDPAALPLTLRDGERVWTRSWADLAIQVDRSATARLAYQVGREGTPKQQYGDKLQALLSGYHLSPVIVLPDQAQAIAALEALVSEVFVPPTNATLIIRPDGITPMPGQAGWELDAETTAAALPHSVGVGPEGLEVEIQMRKVEPAISEAGPALAQAEALLTRPFVIVVEDILTGFGTSWTVDSETVMAWLVVEEIEDDEGARLILGAQEGPIRATLEGLATQLPDDLDLDIERTMPEIQRAIEVGESQAAAALAHAPRIYVVRPGDTLMSIGRAHGFPVWWLIEANPDIDPEDLRPGQQITIPSIDVLFPYPLIASRRILIDISDQHLYAYEGETLIHDFLCSTGIASSPTMLGTFQILSKEENAYASSWNLWMPHFMGVYHSGPDFTNGIHGMPSRDGQQIRWALGSPASYGCIVIDLDEAATLYDWADLGTLVIIQE
jgi:lipoprotein-anchoring transpeptidase ErfK/SrfK